MNDEKRPVGEWIYDTTIAGMRYYRCSICATGYNTIANEDDMNKLVMDGEYIHYSIPVPPIPRACTTYTLVRHFWKMCEFANYVVHVLPDHVNRPLDITVTPKKFYLKYLEEKI